MTKSTGNGWQDLDVPVKAEDDIGTIGGVSFVTCHSFREVLNRLIQSSTSRGQSSLRSFGPFHRYIHPDGHYFVLETYARSNRIRNCHTA